MRFKTITIENFGPFKERQTIDFTDSSGVSIIWGDNGKGKTSLLNAFRFVLLGIVKDRSGENTNYLGYINKIGFKEGHYSFKVTLVVEDENEKYTITRSVSPVLGVSVPKTNEDLHKVLRVNCNGNILSSEESEKLVKNLMPHDVSRFFLFDGELLEEYEELLVDNSREGEVIKHSIEQILGIPVLSNAKNDAADTLQKYNTEATKIAANDKNCVKYSNQINQLDNDIQEHKKEKKRHEDELKKLSAREGEIEEEMRTTEKLRQYLNDKSTVEGRISEKRDAHAELKNEIVELMKDAHKWMIATTVRSVEKNLSAQIHALDEKEATFKSQQESINYIVEVVNSLKCPVCESEFDNDDYQIQHLNDKLMAMKNASTGLTSDEINAKKRMSEKYDILQPFVDEVDQSNLIKSKINKLTNLQVEISDLENNELANIENNLKLLRENSNEEDDPFKIVNELADVKKQMTILGNSIEAEQNKIDEFEDKKEKLRTKMLKLNDNKDVARAEAKKNKVQDILSLFEEGINVYREKLRKDVESDATEIFLSISKEEGYKGLSINENFGLEIKLEDGDALPNRSAGWEHIVAFSLIGALHKNAPLSGPIIMDSPFMRISSNNKMNMVRALPGLSDQVMLLALPGEIDEGSTRVDIGEYIVQERIINTVNALQSSIEGSV